MPDWKILIKQRLAPLGLTAAAETDLADEIAQHLEDRYRELRSGGADDEDARRIALSEFGEIDALQSALNNRQRMPRRDPVPAGHATANPVAALWRDVRYAMRSMRKSPIFVVFVVLTLALGIGANTTVFTLINTLLLNPLPVRDVSTLAAVAGVENSATSKSSAPFPISYPDLKDYQSQNHVFRSLAGYTANRLLTIQEKGSAERIFAELVTENYFSTLGLTPARGRFFAPEEEGAPGTHPVAVMSYGTWQDRFGGRDEVIGRTLKLNGIGVTVIGVAPRSFIGLNAIFGPDLWIPAAMAQILLPNELQNVLSDRAKSVFTGIGRFNPGVGRAQAQANLATIAAGLAREYAPLSEGHSIAVRPVRDVLFGSASTGSSPIVFASAVLLIVVGIVLLIACSNVANLLLARSASRRQEIAVRLAMGASRPRLVQQLLTESVLLGLLSGALGLFVAYAGLHTLFGRLPAAANFATPKLDAVVFLFALGVSILTGLTFGIAPALEVSRGNVAETLKEEARTAGRSRRRLTAANLLVVGQVAFSFLLLMTAALFLRSIRHAYEMDPGFQTAHLATFMTNPGQVGYAKPQTQQFYKRVRERLASVPGVASVSWASNLPLWARPESGLDVEGRQRRSQSDSIRAIVTTVGRDYFDTTGITLTEGRDFADIDQASSTPVAIVNQKMAHDYWPGGALGKRLLLPGEKQMRQIVGVARTANYTTWGEAPQACVYIPLEQNYSDSMTLFVRSKRDPHEILSAVQREVRALAPEVLLSAVRTGGEIMDGGLFQAKMGVGLLTAFGLLALGLASIGLYGILAYSVNRRKREIGVRMALGASQSAVLRLVLSQGMSLVGMGVVIGLVAALFVERLLSRMLFGVSAADPLSAGAAVLILCAAGLLACYLPAYAATRVDPLTALREA